MRERLKFNAEHQETRFRYKFRLEQKRRHEQRVAEKKEEVESAAKKDSEQLDKLISELQSLLENKDD